MDKKKINILVISGPSGVGKSAIIRKILKSCKACAELTTATTRQPRPGERDKKDYYFLSKEEFLNAMEKGDIPEHRYVPEADTYYGTYLPDLFKKAKSGKLIVVDVDIIGAKFFKENFNAFLVFVMPPSKEALLERIRKRKDNMSDKELKERMQIAKREMSEDSKFYDFIVVNETGALDKTVSIICKKAEEYFSQELCENRI